MLQKGIKRTYQAALISNAPNFPYKEMTVAKNCSSPAISLSLFMNANPEQTSARTMPFVDFHANTFFVRMEDTEIDGCRVLVG
jgi:hypothetical protein